MKEKGSLYLIPNVLGEEYATQMLPTYVTSRVSHISRFIVEHEKNARALVKVLGLQASQQQLELLVLNEHTPAAEKSGFLQAALQGHDMGLISDAGLPCVADPGSEIVAMAQNNDIRVVPLPGPSSLMLALMASGFNGQSFTFHGYLPIDRQARSKKLKELERDARQKKQTQLFIETPYRNNQMIKDILQNCDPSTRLCLAADITQPNEWIRSKTVAAWKKDIPDLHKRPAVFLLA